VSGLALRGALAAGLALLGAPWTGRAQEGRPAAGATAAAAARGVAWLCSAQNVDGSWGSFESRRPGEIWTDTRASHRAFGQASTALCVLALERPARRDPAAAAAFRRGVERLLAEPPVGRASGQTFYDTWTHTYMLEALARAAGSPLLAARREAIRSTLQREVGLLAERQSADGGWGYYDFEHSRPVPSGNESTSFLTGAALLALRAAADAGARVEPRIVADGLTCLARLRLPSGAYAYGTYAQLLPAWDPNEVKGSLCRSQPCNLALFLAGRGGVDAAALRAGLDALRAGNHFLEIGRGRPMPHEAWYATSGYYVLFGRYYAARVVRALPPAERGDHAAWLAASTLRWQEADGSWFDFPLYGYHKAYGTAYALLMLQELELD
jgi:hypothetical protein